MVRQDWGEKASRFNTEFNIDIVKLLIFNRNASKITGFMIACKLYIRMKIKEILVEEQVQ